MVRITVATASATGAAHLRKGIGNEDAARWASTGGSAVLAVADGHSDARCIRADRGARFAVDAAVDLAVDDGAATAPELVAAWTRLVEADREADPLPEEVGDPLLPYGTTAIVCWIDGARFHLLQIGDGAVVAATRTAAARPVPPDGHEGTGATDSLASGARTARSVTMPLTDLPAVVCLSTDGVDSAYPDDLGLPRAVAELRGLAVEQGPAAMAARLDTWVQDAATTSGDDATVAVAVIMQDDREEAR